MFGCCWGLFFLSQNTCFERDVLLAITHKLVNTTKSLHAQNIYRSVHSIMETSVVNIVTFAAYSIGTRYKDSCWI